MVLIQTCFGSFGKTVKRSFSVRKVDGTRVRSLLNKLRKKFNRDLEMNTYQRASIVLDTNISKKIRPLCKTNTFTKTTRKRAASRNSARLKRDSAHQARAARAKAKHYHREKANQHNTHQIDKQTCRSYSCTKLEVGQARLRSINIQWPYSQLLLLRQKVVETRPYPMHTKNTIYGRTSPGEVMWLIETPGCARNARSTDDTHSTIPKLRPSQAHVVGLICFESCCPYTNLRDYKKDVWAHRVHLASDKAWGGQGVMYRWAVRFVLPIVRLTQLDRHDRRWFFCMR